MIDDYAIELIDIYTLIIDKNDIILSVPSEITKLVFINFNNLCNNIPNTVCKLNFDYHFKQSILNLPNSITELVLHFNENHTYSPDNLPNSIKMLKIIQTDNYCMSYDNLPNLLNKLIIVRCFQQDINYKTNTNILIHNNLPKSIKIFKLIIIHVKLCKCYLINNIELPHYIELLPKFINNLIMTKKDILIRGCLKFYCIIYEQNNKYNYCCSNNSTLLIKN